MRRSPSVAVLGALVACSSIRGDLATAQTLYADARYEQAQLWLLSLDREVRDMEPELLARFCYLRGMTAFRLGQREDALHYLVLASELNEQPSGRLPSEWQAVLDRTLLEVVQTNASPQASHVPRPGGT